MDAASSARPSLNLRLSLSILRFQHVKLSGSLLQVNLTIELIAFDVEGIEDVRKWLCDSERICLSSTNIEPVISAF